MSYRLTCLVALTGCAAGNADPGVAIDTLPGGIVHVVNRTPLDWADTSGWKIVLEAEHTFPLDSAGSLQAPNYPHTFADGGMVVFDQLARVIQRYDADFTPIGTFGRQGSGPGEFESPAVAVFGDSVIVLEGAKLLLFARDGAYLGHSMVPFSDALGIRDRRGLLALTGRYRSSGKGVMWWSVGEQRVIDSIVGPSGPPQRMWDACRFVIPFQASLELVPTHAGEAWYGVSDADRFVLTRTGADSLRLVETPNRPRFPIDTAQVNEMFAPGSPYLKMCPIMRREDLPTERPAWRWLAVDAQDNLWVGRPASYGRSFDVYDPSGRGLGEVPNPISRDENDYWQGDAILSVTRTDEDGYTLRRYRIRR